jgi:hypothetical protein
MKDSRSFISSCEADWEEKTRFRFAVFDVRSGLFRGGAELSQYKPSHHFANLGYWV